MLLAHAKVWHYYISIFLIIPIMAVVLAILLGYAVKVIAPKYGRR